MRALYISLHSEFYKSRNTLAFWAAILLPLVICGMISFGFFSNQEKILKMHYSPEMLWITFSGASLGVMGMLILPFYVIFIAFSVNNIEHKNDTWKSLFSQPLNKFGIYAAKYLYALFLIFLCLFLFLALTIAFAYLLAFLVPEFKFNAFDPVLLLAEVYFKLFLSALGILSLQFIFSLIWGDFLKPMGIGFIGIITGIIAASKGWEYAFLIPYCTPALTIAKSRTGSAFHVMVPEMWTSIICAVVFFIAGYFIVTRKNIK